MRKCKTGNKIPLGIRHAFSCYSGCEHCNLATQHKKAVGGAPAAATKKTPPRAIRTLLIRTHTKSCIDMSQHSGGGTQSYTLCVRLRNNFGAPPQLWGEIHFQRARPTHSFLMRLASLSNK